MRAVSPETRRTIFVLAFEEDAVFDLLSGLMRDVGQDAAFWVAVIRAEAAAGTLGAYRYGEDRAGGRAFGPVDPSSASPEDFNDDYTSAVYLCGTDDTIPTIGRLPPPPPGDSLRITGLWPAQS